MINIKIISIGDFKEKYWVQACAEYEKRLSSDCKIETSVLKETRLSDNPSDAEISRTLEKEAERILEAVPPRAFLIALCVEGKQMSSEQLALTLEKALSNGENSSICFVIGSSHGLADKVKKAAKLRLSVSELTFPHQLMKVMLLEIIYRSVQIQKGTKYHK